MRTQAQEIAAACDIAGVAVIGVILALHLAQKELAVGIAIVGVVAVLAFVLWANRHLAQAKKS